MKTTYRVLIARNEDPTKCFCINGTWEIIKGYCDRHGYFIADDFGTGLVFWYLFGYCPLVLIEE